MSQCAKRREISRQKRQIVFVLIAVREGNFVTRHFSEHSFLLLDFCCIGKALKKLPSFFDKEEKRLKNRIEVIIRIRAQARHVVIENRKEEVSTILWYSMIDHLATW